MEDADTVQNGILIACGLANDPSPPPTFNMIVTRTLMDNSIENVLSSPTMNLLLNNSLLSLLFDNDSLSLNIDCTVSNSFGRAAASTTIRACGMFALQSEICTHNTALHVRMHNYAWLLVWYYYCVGPTECQEGITNNCTQICTRNATMSGESSHECSCYDGYSQNDMHTNLCDGEFNCYVTVPILLLILIVLQT